MEIVKETLENAIGRAEECRLLTNHPARLRIHIEYINDLVKTFIKCGFKADSPNDDRNEVLAAAMETLKNLRGGVTAVKYGSKPAIFDVRAELEKNSGCKLPSFDGTNDIDDFIIRFSTVVMDRVEISDVIRLIVLKNCLKGVAFDLVNVLPTSAKNFQLAIHLLKRVYRDSKQTIELYHSMVALPQVSSSDGTEFRRTFYELERILQSMKDNGLAVDDDFYLRPLYLQKFPEETLMGELVRDPYMWLFEMRADIRHLVYLQLQELNNQKKPSAPEKSSGDTENAENQPKKRADKRKVPFNVELPSGTIKINAVVANLHPINSKPNEGSDEKKACMRLMDSELEAEFDESSEYADGDGGNYVSTLNTVCAPVSYRSGEKKSWSTVRILLQNLPPISFLSDLTPVSLLSESAAKRLGINVRGQKKTMRLRSTLGEHFRVTQTAFKLTLDLGNGTCDCIKVHIVDDSVSFVGYVEPARSVVEFKKKHPQLSHLQFGDPGEGRPVELFLAGKYEGLYLPELWRNFPKPPSNCPPVKRGWTLLPSVFGFLVGGKVKEEPNSNRPYTYSFEYDD